MTDEELRAHWGETEPPPVAPSALTERELLGVCAVVLGALIILLSILVPCLAQETQEQEQREVRQCELARVMRGERIAEAELLCRREP
jgi:Na+-transporting methylmalonyl-CoA/oxaloacetate decarboxylase beta subunit